MSGYIHTISFKVLIDSEVVDFTFRVPRGTLLVQVLDELETTLKIQPRVIATVNHNGEIIIIDNHYSTVDYLMQKHGTEFFAGGSSVVTFNHGEYIIDLDVPEAIPYASTFRTACKSFSIMPRDVSIERQNGQVMDFEVFRMPTAFVLNSWGNFYRIVNRELGDPLIDPPKGIDEDPIPKSGSTIDLEIKPQPDTMVYPPKLDDSELIGIGNELMEATSEESEIDAMTDHYVETSFPEDSEEELAAADDDQTIESLMDEIRLDDESAEEEVTEDDEEEFLTEPMKDPLEDSVITDVSLPDEELVGTPLDELVDFGDEIDSLEDTISEEEEEGDPQEEDDLVIFAQDYEEGEEEILEEEEDEGEQIFEEFIDEEDIEEDTEDHTSEEISPTFEDMISTTASDESEDEGLEFEVEEDIDDLVIEDEESIPEFAISDLPDSEETKEEPLAPTQPFDEDRFIDSIRDHYIKEDSEEEVSSITAESAEIEEEETVDEEPRVLAALTEDLVVVESEDEYDSVVREIDEITEQPKIAPIVDDLPLDKRLELRKQELTSLEAALNEEERLKDKIQQRTISIYYHDKMNPRKIFPLTVKMSSTISDDQNGHHDQLRIVPVFPGCYVTPHEEIIELNGDDETNAEFTVTPLISGGTVNGKLGVWYKGRNILNINTISKIRNYTGSIISGILAFLFGLMPFLLLIFSVDINAALATGLNNIFSSTISANVFMYIEIALLVVLLGLMIGFIFVGKPTKRKLKRKFYPIAPKHDD